MALRGDDLVVLARPLTGFAGGLEIGSDDSKDVLDTALMRDQINVTPTRASVPLSAFTRALTGRDG